MYLKPAYDFSVYAAWNLRCHEFYMARGQKIFADDGKFKFLILPGYPEVQGKILGNGRRERPDGLLVI